MNRLIEDALANNPGLSEALARVRGAQARAQAVGATTQPSVTLDGDEVRQRFSENFYIPPPYGGSQYWVGQVTANLNWTLDFWGRQADLIRQANLQARGALLDQAAARLALSGALAQTYCDLYRAYALADIATQSEQQRTTLLKLTRDRVRAGLDSQLEVRNAEALLPQARAARLQAESARDLAVHQLAAFSGRGADAYASIVRPRLVADAALPLPEQLPIDLLARRPDVLAARARVDAATAGRAGAREAFYPDVSLRAFAGYQSLDLDNLFDAGSGVWGIGPSIHLPLFDSQRLRANYLGATAELDAVIASYNQTVLNAVREVADQITLSQSLAWQLAQSQLTLDASEAAYALAQRRYAAGLTSQIVVLDAESRVLNARRDVVSLRTSLAIAHITLLVSVGGTFDPSTPDTVTVAGALQ
ncbi:MAG: efflux transporter outer membrane subunit [Halioglobus sp.]